MFELVFLTGARAGQVVPVVKTMLAGRSPDCSLEVPDPNTSRQHSRFIFDGSSVTVLDNGSSNGTYVNDVKLNAPYQLNHGDIVRLGETRMRFQHAAHGSHRDTSSSIFSFKEQEEDLSQSIVMAVTDVPRKILSPEELSARLSAIIKVSKALVNIHALEQVFDGILETLLEVFPQADRGFLMLGSEVEKLEPRAMRQRGKAVTENLAVSSSICRKALESKTAILFDDSKTNDFDQGMSIVSLRIRSAMTVPLLVNDNVLGLLQIDTPDRSRAFVTEDLELAIAVSQQAAIALHNALLLKKVETETAVRNNLVRFLPAPVVQQAIDGQLDLALGGSTCKGTIMFADIIGFTRTSEKLSPEQVVKMMNGYFNRMVPCIERTGGSIDKFMGDAIMAVWGIPFDKGDSALCAAQAALSMQTALVGFNAFQAMSGAVSLGMGIGVNTGAVVAGNVGADNRCEYTVLGDNVNVAQRLESAASRDQVLVSEQTFKELGAGVAFGLAMPPLKVKNKGEPLTTFSLRGLCILDREIALHLPVRCGDRPVFLIRRLADRTFLALHAPDVEICAKPLITAIAEWPSVDLGTPAMESVLPSQDSDGSFIRSQIRLPDDTLAGLLGELPLRCTTTWDTMTRG
jgi:adenylate cyclase